MAFASALEDRGVEISVIGDRNRFCTHLDVTSADIDTALEVVKTVIGAKPKQFFEKEFADVLS